MYEDSSRDMAHVEWSAGIDSISGALSKPGNNPQHSCNKMLLGTHRVAPTENNQCNRLYLRKKTVRTTPITPDEAAARLRFSTVAAMVKQRKGDLTKIAADQAAFLDQKDLADGKKTLKAYYWLICGNEYDSNQG